MQYEIDRTQYEMNDLTRQLIGSSLSGSTGGQMPDDFPGRDESLPARRNIMATPAANVPHESPRHLWDYLRRNEESWVAFAQQQECRERAFRAVGDPSVESHRGDIPGNNRASQGSTVADRDMTKVRATEFGRSAATFSGPVGESAACRPSGNTSSRREGQRLAKRCTETCRAAMPSTPPPGNYRSKGQERRVPKLDVNGSCPSGSGCPCAHDADTRAPKGEGNGEQSKSSSPKEKLPSLANHTNDEEQVCKFYLKRKCNKGEHCD